MFKGISGWQRMIFAVCLLVLVIGGFVDLFAQPGAGGTATGGALKATLTGMNAGVFKVIKGVGYVLGFGMGIWQFMEGWSQQQLSSKWLTFIGIAIFLAVLNQSDSIYAMLANTDQGNFVAPEADDKLNLW
jgi:hypothetical protein